MMGSAYADNVTPDVFVETLVRSPIRLEQKKRERDRDSNRNCTCTCGFICRMALFAFLGTMPLLLWQAMCQRLKSISKSDRVNIATHAASETHKHDMFMYECLSRQCFRSSCERSSYINFGFVDVM